MSGVVTASAGAYEGASLSFMLQILTPSGELVGESPLDIGLVRRLYRAMNEARAYDVKSTALQKQGRLATYSGFLGQEAAQVGSAAALDPDDWMVGSYRDAAAMWMQGYPWEQLVLGRTGDERGGRPPEHVPVLPPSITVGGHMIHAVGLSWASRLQGSQNIAITYFGDGATSEGDFHEAMNFAGVYQTPTVFFCQNNGYAISLPTSEQTASESIAIKADAYGMPGVQVDGNDLLAVYQATKTAVDRARAGDGPTLIEAVTYRLGPHTTNDDPTRYRSKEEEEAAFRNEPMVRVRLYLESQGQWDEDWQDKIDADAMRDIERAVEMAESLTLPTADEMFGGMFEEPTSALVRQAQEAAR